MNLFKRFSSPCCVNVNHIFLEILNLSPTTSFKSSLNFSSSTFHGCTVFFKHHASVVFLLNLLSFFSHLFQIFCHRLFLFLFLYLLLLFIICLFSLCVEFPGLQLASSILQFSHKMLSCHGQVLVKLPEIQSRFTDKTIVFFDDIFLFLIIPYMKWLFADSFILSDFSTMVTAVQTKSANFLDHSKITDDQSRIVAPQVYPHPPKPIVSVNNTRTVHTGIINLL